MAVLFIGRPTPKPWHHSHSRPQPGQNSNRRPYDFFIENYMQFSSLYTLNGIVGDIVGLLLLNMMS